MLQFYAEDNDGWYMPIYSGWYLFGASTYKAQGDPQGLVLLLPYLFKSRGGTDIWQVLANIKGQSGDIPRMKIFWCPSGEFQYDAFNWQQTAFASFGYNQYCSRSYINDRACLP